MECRLLLDVVVLECPPVLKLLASEDETLLVRGDALLVLDLGLDVLDLFLILDFDRGRRAGRGLHGELHAAAKPQHQVERRLLLDVVVGQRPAVRQLLAGEDQPLLVRRDPLLLLDLCLAVLTLSLIPP